MGSLLEFEFTEMFDNQDQTDCVFKLISSSSTSENKDESGLVRAHKLVLSTASPVFKTMLSKQWSSDEKPIEIKDVDDPELFKKFIRTIYINTLNLNRIEDAINFFKMAHLYQTDDILEQSINLIIKLCTFNNVFQLYDIGRTYEIKRLKNVCKKVFAKYATNIFDLPEFLAAEPKLINKIYSMDPLNITSENQLVTTLDKYIVQNKDDIPEIITKLKLAIEGIRILLVEDNVINECINEDFKTILLKRKRKFLHASAAAHADFDKRIMKMKVPRGKPTLLYFLAPKIQEQLYKLYKFDYCLCCQENHNAVACEAFSKKWNYPNLSNLLRLRYASLHDYSDEDLKIILDAFKKAEGRYFDVFTNYDLYLES